MNRYKQTLKINKESVDKMFPKKDIDITGWESPIDVVMGQMRISHDKCLEDNTIMAIQEYGITVDKDELIKALQYDRDQYNKGFDNGYNKGASDVAREIFEEIVTKVNSVISTNQKEKDELIYKGFFNEELLATFNNKIEVLRSILTFIAKLKKKYESEGEG